VRLSYEIETPVAIGFRRPVILIPTELATADGLAAIEPLVLHEHAHLRRYDDWTNLVQRVIERLFWFNPIVWLVGRRIALEREIASDDAVVERTGAPKEYATSLWRLAREMRMPEHAVVAPGALLTRKQISVRIEQLLDANRARLHRSPAAALGVATAGVFAVAFVATSSPAVELPASPPAPALAPLNAHHPAAPPRHGLRAFIVLSPPVVSPPLALPSPAPVPHVPRATSADAIQQTVHDALAAVPAEIAAGLDGRTPGRTRLNGVRLTRELVAACRGCSMRGADLHGLDLHGLTISGADLRDADLRGVNLSGARVIGTSLAAADLTSADLRGAELKGVDLSRADLRGVDLTNAHLEACDLGGTDLRGARTAGTVLHGSALE
jgi:hypothetical protein